MFPPHLTWEKDVKRRFDYIQDWWYNYKEDWEKEDEKMK
jgi:hypothetical protein